MIGMFAIVLRRAMCRWFSWHEYGDSYDVMELRVAECMFCGRRLVTRIERREAR